MFDQRYRIPSKDRPKSRIAQNFLLVKYEVLMMTSCAPNSTEIEYMVNSNFKNKTSPTTIKYFVKVLNNLITHSMCTSPKYKCQACFYIFLFALTYTNRNVNRVKHQLYYRYIAIFHLPDIDEFIIT